MKSLSRAFTMIELIFVIVVIGILASVIIPMMEASKSNTVQQQSTQQNSETTWEN